MNLWFKNFTWDLTVFRPRGHKTNTSSLLITASLLSMEYIAERWKWDQKWARFSFMVLGRDLDNPNKPTNSGICWLRILSTILTYINWQRINEFWDFVDYKFSILSDPLDPHNLIKDQDFWNLLLQILSSKSFFFQIQTIHTNWLRTQELWDWLYVEEPP